MPDALKATISEKTRVGVATRALILHGWAV
jgi:hypothetical protein